MPHIHEKIDFTADALIVHKDKVLLRMHDKYHVWLQVGGHIELNEDPVEALFREIKEECGLEVELVGDQGEVFDPNNKRLPVPSFIHRHMVSQTHEHVNFIYVLCAKTLEIKPGPNEKPVEFKWFTAEELQDKKFAVGEPIKYYASRAIKIANS